jgi:hypothetical protein
VSVAQEVGEQGITGLRNPPAWLRASREMLRFFFEQAGLQDD